MTTEPAPPITALPPLPNPAHPRNAGPLLALNASDALRVMRLLGEGAANGSTEYPYPTSTEYPLPPLPAVPVPSRAGASRRIRPPPPKPVHPLTHVPLPASSPLATAQTLDDVLAAHNALTPPMPAALHYGRSALLVHVPGRGHCWALLRTLGPMARGEDVKCLAVRFFPTRDPRPPPVHAMPPQGPPHVTSETLTALRLSVPELLWRLRCLAGAIDMPCFYCGKHLSDLDGLPMGCFGFLPGAKKSANGVDEDGKDKDKDEKRDEQKDEQKEREKKDEEKETGSDSEEGRWVAWHPRCEQ